MPTRPGIREAIARSSMDSADRVAALQQAHPARLAELQEEKKQAENIAAEQTLQKKIEKEATPAQLQNKIDQEREKQATAVRTAQEARATASHTSTETRQTTTHSRTEKQAEAAHGFSLETQRLQRDRNWHNEDRNREALTTVALAGLTGAGVAAVATAIVVGVGGLPFWVAAGTIVGTAYLTTAGVGLASRFLPPATREAARGA